MEYNKIAFKHNIMKTVSFQRNQIFSANETTTDYGVANLYGTCLLSSNRSVKITSIELGIIDTTDGYHLIVEDRVAKLYPILVKAEYQDEELNNMDSIIINDNARGLAVVVTAGRNFYVMGVFHLKWVVGGDYDITTSITITYEEL